MYYLYLLLCTGVLSVECPTHSSNSKSEYLLMYLMIKYNQYNSEQNFFIISVKLTQLKNTLRVSLIPIILSEKYNDGAWTSIINNCVICLCRPFSRA